MSRIPHLNKYSESNTGLCYRALFSNTTRVRATHLAKSVRERATKARTAFPVGPMARVDGGCMELDVPALITGGCLSALVT